MMYLAAWMVWGALAVVGYVYAGYPLTLWLLSRIRHCAVRQEMIFPSVTLIISAFNEERSISAKLENSLALDYPEDLLQILVVSDASTDETDRIVQQYGGKRVSLLRMPERRGKTVGLNAAMQRVQSEVVVFSDANILYQRDAIRRLVRNFADPMVGCVTGNSCYSDAQPSAAHEQENAYWGYERFIRTLESKIGSTVGGDGAIFAIRRKLYTPLLPEAINDLVVPFQIVARGHRAIFEPQAIGYERSAGNFAGEFRRKRRIVNRSWRGLMSVSEVLDPRRVGLFAWQVWSHKVLRWLVLPIVSVAAVGCIIAFPLGLIYRVGTFGFIASVVIAGIGGISQDRVGRLMGFAHGLFYFYMVNLAAFLGVVMALFGRVEVLWTPERK